jgi:ribonuclease D
LTAEEVPPPSARLTLRDPLPPVVEDVAALDEYCDAVVSGSGPIALDAERASGYRYSQRAYLVQVRRESAGTALIDPIATGGDLSALDAAIGDTEWILHAATQDLACLAEVGLRPRRLFDTEHAGRLLNLPRVGLASLVEHYLGRSLAKEHSAADWSTRPLPEPWLVYAALDVEVLIELRDLIAADLEQAGKTEWAAQDFEALLSFTGAPTREEPWRRTSGIHQARGRRALGLVREIWQARDAIAAERDVTPGRILPDGSILEMARTPPSNLDELGQMKVMRNRGPRRFIRQWHDAIERALAMPDAELPHTSPRREGPPPPRVWAEKFPEAAGRLGRSREAVTALSVEHDVPSENLLSPQLVRAVAWEPPDPLSADSVGDVLVAGGARPWQVGLTAEPLAAALSGDEVASPRG